MRKQINKITSTENTNFRTQLHIVETESNRVHVEIEIENHVKSIRALVNKLRPQERQKYFNGLLSHLLTKEVEYPLRNVNSSRVTCDNEDFSKLSGNDLELIRELSCKLQDLYLKSGDVLE